MVIPCAKIRPLSNPIPVYLVTGFLGAGKTTFLNHFISAVAPQRVLVVENEVGAVNIDGALVATGAEDVVELTAGCLCCSLLGDLHLVLERVSAQRDDFDILVIETTGVADPSSIVQLFLADQRIQAFFDLQRVICLADIGNIEIWLRESNEALRQLAMSDTILLSKADLANDATVGHAVEVVRTANPTASILQGCWGVFPLEHLLAPSAKESVLLTQRLQSFADTAPLASADAKAGAGHGITSFSLTFEDPFVLSDAFSVQLYRLVEVYRDQVYRIKGILDVVGYPNRIILQSVRNSCVLSDGPVWRLTDTRCSQLVFIGRGLQKKTFEKLFAPYTQTPISINV